MRKSERVALVCAVVPVSVGALLGVYTLHGPVLHTPVVVTIPDAVMNVVAGDLTIGYYNALVPDVILLTEVGKDDAATLPHEMLHYSHPDWSECEVSTYLYSTTGLIDGYHGRC